MYAFSGSHAILKSLRISFATSFFISQTGTLGLWRKAQDTCKNSSQRTFVLFSAQSRAYTLFKKPSQHTCFWTLISRWQYKQHFPAVCVMMQARLVEYDNPALSKQAKMRTQIRYDRILHVSWLPLRWVRMDGGCWQL